MKTIAVLVVLIVVSNAFAQDWRDTLELARTAYKSKDYEKALGFYEKAQKSAPQGVDFSDEMGQSAYKAEKYDVAEQIYQQNQANKSSSKEQADNYHNLGNSRMRQKNYEGAVEAYKDALRRNPNDEETRYNLSEAMRKIKKKEEQESCNKPQNSGQKPPQPSQGNNSSGQNNSGDQNKSGNKSSQGKEGQKPGQSPKQQKNGQGGGNSSQPEKGKGQLSNKTAERLLDDLMKREAQTQRKIAGYGAGSGKSKSGKDW